MLRLGQSESWLSADIQTHESGDCEKPSSDGRFKAECLCTLEYRFCGAFCVAEFLLVCGHFGNSNDRIQVSMEKIELVSDHLDAQGSTATGPVRFLPCRQIHPVHSSSSYLNP